jgi:hypothetical protein
MPRQRICWYRTYSRGRNLDSPRLIWFNILMKRTVVAAVPGGLTREKGFIYFIDKDGDVSRTKVPPGHTSIRYAHLKVSRLHVPRKAGYWYFLDKAGQVLELKRPN